MADLGLGCRPDCACSADSDFMRLFPHYQIVLNLAGTYEKDMPGSILPRSLLVFKPAQPEVTLKMSALKIFEHM